MLLFFYKLKWAWKGQIWLITPDYETEKLNPIFFFVNENTGEVFEGKRIAEIKIVFRLQWKQSCHVHHKFSLQKED